MILYSYFRSSASYRVRIALEYKKIPFEYKSIHLLKKDQQSQDYKKLNPSGEVPCLIHDGKALSQSVAIIDYLEHIHPEPKLFPKDAFQKAQVLQVCEIINSGIQPLQNLKVTQELEKRFPNEKEVSKQWAQHWIAQGLTSLENTLQKTAGIYSFGNQVTAADCFLIPQLFASRRFQVDINAYPTLLKIEEACLKLEAFQKAHPQRQPDFE